jgi:hypothetical protein
MIQGMTKEAIARWLHFSSMKQKDSKSRFLDKLHVIDGLDPYETERRDWNDGIDLWPSLVLCT